MHPNFFVMEISACQPVAGCWQLLYKGRLNRIALLGFFPSGFYGLSGNAMLCSHTLGLFWLCWNLSFCFWFNWSRILPSYDLVAFTSKQTSYLRLGNYKGLNSLMRSSNVILFHL